MLYRKDLFCFNMRKNSLLWEIRNATGELAGYLFGTIHLSHPEIDSKIVAPLQIMDSVDCLYLEINPAEFDISFLHPKEGGVKIQDLKLFYSKPKYERLKKHLIKFCDLNLDYFMKTNPVVLMSYIESSLSNASLKEGMDMRLYLNAKKAGIPVNGLIALEQEYESMNQFNDQLKGNELYQFSRNFKLAKRNIRRLIKLYKDEDIHQLYKLSKKPLGAMRKPLLYERNFKILEKVKAETQTGKKILAAVGAGHLSGEFGLIRLLRMEGYNLTPVEKMPGQN